LIPSENLEKATDLLEQISQVGHGFRFFFHSACGPYAGIARLDCPRVCPSFAEHIPLLFSLFF
jgi:hypothetical protein